MPAETPTIAKALHADGYAVVDHVLEVEALDRLVEVIERAQATWPDSPSLRNVLDNHAEVRAVLREPGVVALLNDALGEGWFAVRAILFDKAPGANWSVGWHQDQCIAVKERIETLGFGPWSVKEGVTHVEPPIGVLERMATLRLHLDDCFDDNGPLRIVPGSHTHGWLGADAIRAMREERGVVACTPPRGGAVLMRPLILHSSRPAATPSHRRVLHVECAAFDLPAPLDWHARWR